MVQRNMRGKSQDLVFKVYKQMRKTYNAYDVDTEYCIEL